MLKSWELSTANKNIADQRCRRLGGYPKWLPRTLAIFAWTKSMKAVDLVHLVESGLDYILEDLYPNEDIATTVQLLTETLRILLSATSDCQEDDASEANAFAKQQALKLTIIQNLSEIELFLPETELSEHLHDLIHFPDLIFRWNSVRNFWAFFSERLLAAQYTFFLNHIIHIIHILQFRWLDQELYSQPNASK